VVEVEVVVEMRLIGDDEHAHQTPSAGAF
jgi:hypothetical protein